MCPVSYRISALETEQYLLYIFFVKIINNKTNMAEQGKSGREAFNPNRIYNVTEEELRAIQERAKMREAMKKEFQQKVSNPYRGVGGYIVSDLQSLTGHFASCLDVSPPEQLAPRRFATKTFRPLPLCFVPYLDFSLSGRFFQVAKHESMT